MVVARGKQDINARIERQEKKILKMTNDLEEAKEQYEALMIEKRETEKESQIEAFEKSRRSMDEVPAFLKGKPDI